jgi:hypothetical protein
MKSPWNPTRLHMRLAWVEEWPNGSICQPMEGTVLNVWFRNLQAWPAVTRQVSALRQSFESCLQTAGPQPLDL